MTTQYPVDNFRVGNNNEKLITFFLILFFILFSISFVTTIYRLITKPDVFQRNINFDIQHVERSNDYISMNIEKVVEFPSFFKIQGWAILNGTPSNEVELYIILESKEKKFIFDIQSQRRPDVTIAYKKANYDNSGFLCHISKSILIPGEYYIGVYVKGRNQEFMRMSGYPVTVNN